MMLSKPRKLQGAFTLSGNIRKTSTISFKFFFISFSIRYHIQETAEVCTLRILFHCNHLSRKFCQEICAKILNIIETKTKAGTTFAIHESLSDYRTYAAKVYTDFYSSVITWSVLSGCQQCAFIVYNIWNLFHYKFL